MKREKSNGCHDGNRHQNDFSEREHHQAILPLKVTIIRMPVSKICADDCMKIMIAMNRVAIPLPV
jgi:hypothetical protein